jgi:hypothetical protein
MMTVDEDRLMSLEVRDKYIVVEVELIAAVVNY